MTAHSGLTPDDMIVTNKDPERGKPSPKPEVPQFNVESLENLGSMLELDPRTLDPNFNYRWVNVDSLKVSRAKARGYTFVDADTEEVGNAVGDSPEAKDGRYIVGDVVLMKTHKKIYQERRKKIRKRNETRLRGPEKKFRQEAENASQQYRERIEVITDKEE